MDECKPMPPAAAWARTCSIPAGCRGAPRRTPWGWRRTRNQGLTLVHVQLNLSCLWPHVTQLDRKKCPKVLKLSCHVNEGKPLPGPKAAEVQLGVDLPRADEGERKHRVTPRHSAHVVVQCVSAHAIFTSLLPSFSSSS